MSLRDLLSVLPVPDSRSEEGTHDWATVEAELKTVLPSDYKEYVDTLGTGGISAFLYVFSPFSKNRHLNLLLVGPVILDAYRMSRDQFPELYSYRAFPESEGLLPWGRTDNGDELYWLTRGGPDDWSVVIIESRGAEIEAYDGTMSEFLTALLTGKYVSRIITKRNILPPWFRPAQQG